MTGTDRPFRVEASRGRRQAVAGQLVLCGEGADMKCWMVGVAVLLLTDVASASSILVGGERADGSPYTANYDLDTGVLTEQTGVLPDYGPGRFESITQYIFEADPAGGVITVHSLSVPAGEIPALPGVYALAGIDFHGTAYQPPEPFAPAELFFAAGGDEVYQVEVPYLHGFETFTHDLLFTVPGVSIHVIKVPEPCALALLGTGAAGIAVGWWRRNRR